MKLIKFIPAKAKQLFNTSYLKTGSKELDIGQWDNKFF